MRLTPSAEPAAGSGPVASIQIEQLLAVTGGRLVGETGATAFAGATVDSRRVTPGCLFVALPGERVDGHQFAADAARAGAAALMVRHPIELPPGSDAAVVVVADPLTGLQELAAWWAGRNAARVIGVTGSTGKTIAKEMIADVLSRTLRTLRNEGNLNSEIGLPLTLLRLEPSDEVAVLEMGMYAEGDIARLVEIAHPEVGVVMSVHATHLERAGSLAAIARAKAELPAGLPRDGLAVLNLDDPRVAAMRGVTQAPVRTFGLSATAEVRADEVESQGLAGTSFRLVTPWGNRSVHSATPGRHLIPHALAAAAVAEHFTVPLDEVVAALAAGSRAPHRMAVVAAASGAQLVDDTYNASPVSVAAALSFLAETPVTAGRRRMAVLGDMLELGPEEEQLHREVGVQAAGVLDALVAVGARGRWIAEGARAAGLLSVALADDADDALAVVERELDPGPGDLLLIKGSRGIALDRLVDLLAAGRN